MSVYAPVGKDAAGPLDVVDASVAIDDSTETVDSEPPELGAHPASATNRAKAKTRTW
jgi:hypothetical protein